MPAWMRRFPHLLGCAAWLLCAGAVQAQYPDRPVTVLIGFPPGGMPDIIMRGISEGMKERFPRGLLIVAKPGLGGAIAVSEMQRAAADGYTLVLSPISANVVQPQLNKLSYRTPDDYTPILNLISFSAILVARSDAPWKTVKDVLEAARAKPGALKIGTPGEGTSARTWRWRNSSASPASTYCTCRSRAGARAAPRSSAATST